MQILFLDCLSGISGDMMAGALCDLGVDVALIRGELSKLGLDREFHIHASRTTRQSIEGVKFDVHESHGDSHGQDHGAQGHDSPDPGHRHGRSYREIRDLIDRSGLAGSVKARAASIFARIASAEGKIHGTPAEDVTFHEVGAIDSIVDIVSACAGINALGVEAVHASRLFEGTGFIHCAHGAFPLPSPATLEILAGIPLRQIDEPFEFITPTGAAIAAEFVQSFGPMPEMTIERIGYGVGARDVAPRPNVLRAVLGKAAAPDEAERDEVIQIETNIDDMSAELIGAAADAIRAAGALDVFLTPVQMKKSRPGVLLTVLCVPAEAARFSDLILNETTAFGLRMHKAQREKLRRELRDVETAYGSIPVKYGYRGEKLVQASPEFEACRTAAIKHHLPVQEIFNAASAAASRASRQHREQ